MKRDFTFMGPPWRIRVSANCPPLDFSRAEGDVEGLKRGQTTGPKQPNQVIGRI
jgi:hypothetical protein